MVGLGVPDHVLPVSDMESKISLTPGWRYADTYPRAIQIAVASVTGVAVDGIELPDIHQLITHRFHGIASVNDAIKTAGKTSDDKGMVVIKTVIKL